MPANRIAPHASFDISPALRMLVLAAGMLLALMTATALTKAAMGLVPTPGYARQPAIVVHLVCAASASPLGLWVLLNRKGDRRHRTLGRVWVAMMVATALSAMFIQHLGGVRFSVLHLFVPLPLWSAWQTVASARAGRIAKHKASAVRLFLLALVLPGLFTFLPTRIMGGWLLG